MQAFIALQVASMFVGSAAWMPAIKIISSVQSGMAGTLGIVLTVVGFGAIFGQIIEHSGGVEFIGSFPFGKVWQGKCNMVTAAGIVAGYG